MLLIWKIGRSEFNFDVRFYVFVRFNRCRSDGEWILIRKKDNHTVIFFALQYISAALKFYKIFITGDEIFKLHRTSFTFIFTNHTGKTSYFCSIFHFIA